MPEETKQAIDWAITQKFVINDIEYPVRKDEPISLVTKVREYFNTNNIEYSTFSYEDLIPYL